jgi:hypothetical protein
LWRAFSEAEFCNKKITFFKEKKDIEAISMRKKNAKEGSGLPDLGYKDWLNGVLWA